MEKTDTVPTKKGKILNKFKVHVDMFFLITAVNCYKHLNILAPEKKTKDADSVEGTAFPHSLKG